MADRTPTPTTPDHASPPAARAGHVVHHAEVPEEHPERHEHSDVSVRGIWVTVGAILVVTAIVHVIMYVVFFAYEGAQKAEDEAERRSAITGVVQGPPQGIPRLQGIESYNAETPSVDNLKMEAENRAALNSYGRAADGRVRIPINRAMDLALEQDVFPARPATTQGGGQGGGQGATTTSQPAGGASAGH